MFLLIAHTLLGIRLNLGYLVVWEYLREHFETGLPLPSKIGQHLSFLQELSSNCFINNLFVVCDDNVRLQRLIQRRLDYLNVAEAFELYLLLNASAVFLLTLHEQFSGGNDAGDLRDHEQTGLFGFIVNC